MQLPPLTFPLPASTLRHLSLEEESTCSVESMELHTLSLWVLASHCVNKYAQRNSIDIHNCDGTCAEMDMTNQILLYGNSQDVIVVTVFNLDRN